MEKTDVENPYSFPLQDKVLSALSVNERDFLLLHGGSLRLRESDSDDAVRFAPFFLLPSLFPASGFERATRVQPVMNKLAMAVAHDRAFLTDCLKSAIKVDDFTARLFDIYNRVEAEGVSQRTTLGLLRSDYFASDLVGAISQVEVNVIAAGWSGMSQVTDDMHRYALTELGLQHLLPQLPTNTSMEGIARGMLHAWDHYAVPTAVILFVVEDRTINICDQRFHEFQVFRQRPGVKVIRRSHKQLSVQASLDDNRRLIVDGHEVALVYFRSGYSPADYPSEAEWAVRLLIERSHAIKSPSIHLHLAGTKKVQQELCRAGVLEKYLTEEEVRLCRSVFTGLYSLDMTPEGDAALQMALSEPERFVLKPQREGGGNNVYGPEIADVLAKVKDSPERTAYILMDLIRPHVQPNYLLRPAAAAPQLVQAVGELGVFGYILSDAQKTYQNATCGFTLRSKPASVQEGGIVAGFGAMDSPLLVTKEDGLKHVGTKPCGYVPDDCVCAVAKYFDKDQQEQS